MGIIYSYKISHSIMHASMHYYYIYNAATQMQQRDGEECFCVGADEDHLSCEPSGCDRKVKLF